MIISIDHGNKQIKTLNRTFTSGLYESESKPAFGEDVLYNRFTAYVQKAMENTRNTYYKKKMMLHEHEALYDEFGDTLLVESDDILNAIFTLDMDLIENLSLWKAIRKLSDMDVMIIKLHVLYDNNFNEIAHVLGMKETAVRQRYNRAIHAIRKILEE